MGEYLGKRRARARTPGRASEVQVRVHAAIDLEAVVALILRADRNAAERPQCDEGTERRHDVQVASQVRQGGEFRLRDDVRGPGAAGVEQRLPARAHGQRRELDDIRLEDEVGAVALAELEDDAVPACLREAYGSRVDDVGPTDLHVLDEVASGSVGDDLPMRAARRRGHSDDGAVDRRPVTLDDAALKRGGCDSLRSECTGGQAQRERCKGEQARA